jgi:hypothetical protein
VRKYPAHAHGEETECLPLTEAIRRHNGDHLATLGVSLHLRHVKPVNAYI